MNYEWDQAADAVVLMFWVPGRSIGEPVVLKLSRPNRNNSTRMGVVSQ